MSNILSAEQVEVKINNKAVLKNISLELKRGKVYSIIGPNGSGKTTLLKVLSRSLKPNKGKVLLNNNNIFKQNTKDIAKTMAVLAQVNNANMDIKVKDLVSYGRFSHKQWWQGQQSSDNKIIDWAINKTNLQKYQNRKLSTLSGGERQRAWIAMALAQEPEILLLDEPTTFLDISHQLDVLELIRELNNDNNISILMVLHDINQAAKYSDEIFVIKEGKLYKHGDPWQIVNQKTIKDVFNVNSVILTDEETKRPIFYPKK